MSELDDSQIEDIFQSFDKKKKGVLDRYEVKEFFKKVLIDLEEDTVLLTSENLLKQFYEMFDKNKDGKIDFNEFKSVMELLINEKGYQLN